MTTRALIVLSRKRAILEARDHVIPFTQLMMPDPAAPDDPAFSLYSAQKFHRVVGASLEEVETRKFRRLEFILPPRTGKTTLASKMFPAWYMGRHPNRHIIIATYNEDYSWDLGRSVRDIMQSPAYRQVFPGTQLKSKAAAVNRLETTQGGVIYFVGRGSAITGRGAHVILLDDPIKDRAEADSETIREKLWTWYTQVLRTRLMDRTGCIVMIQTRWHEDDLIGRLTDPLNPHYTVEEANLWSKVDLPALAEEDDILGRPPGQALWPERFDEEYLNELKVSDPRGFMALYQGRPSPKEGAFFRVQDLVGYKSMKDCPPFEEMRFYGASDHAVSLSQKNDKSCIGIVGVDKQDHLWVMPDIVWQRIESMAAVESMIYLMDKYKPQFWWAESGQILKSIGPFLRKRMMEKRVFCAIDPITPTKDKLQRAQAIQARSAMKMVHFPIFARWWAEGQDQLLKFNGSNYRDDLVDFLALIGLGLSKMRPRLKQRKEAPEIVPGTFREMLNQTRKREQLEARRKGLQGWL